VTAREQALRLPLAVTRSAGLPGAVGPGPWTLRVCVLPLWMVEVPKLRFRPARRLSGYSESGWKERGRHAANLNAAASAPRRLRLPQSARRRIASDTAPCATRGAVRTDARVSALCGPHAVLGRAGHGVAAATDSEGPARRHSPAHRAPRASSSCAASALPAGARHRATDDRA
jgi:hypothetical protein